MVYHEFHVKANSHFLKHAGYTFSNTVHYVVSLGLQEDTLLTYVRKSPGPFLQSYYLASHFPACTGDAVILL